jgi:hypothetical protein
MADEERYGLHKSSQSVLARGQEKRHKPSSQTFYVTTTHLLPHMSELLGDYYDTVPGCASSDCIILCGCLEAFSVAFPKCHSFSLAPSLILSVATARRDVV